MTTAFFNYSSTRFSKLTHMRALIILLSITAFAVKAQNGSIDVHLTSGKIISTRYVYLYTSSDSYLRVHEKNGEKISIDLIDHVEGYDQAGNYRYFMPIDLQYNVIWGERGFMSDRITIYHTDIVTGTMSASHKPKRCLYSKDGGPLRRIKLKYLKTDLADCAASQEHLKKGKRIGGAQAGVYVASYSLIIAGMITLVNDSSDKDNDPETRSGPSLPPTVLIGALGAWIPSIMSNAKRERYLDALKVYK
jgi:hypothetical protein